jgi:hypothetical protein
MYSTIGFGRSALVSVCISMYMMYINVTDSGEGVCVDPGGKEASLEVGGPGLPGGGKGWQLASDSGGEET